MRTVNRFLDKDVTLMSKDELNAHKVAAMMRMLDEIERATMSIRDNIKAQLDIPVKDGESIDYSNAAVMIGNFSYVVRSVNASIRQAAIDASCYSTRHRIHEDGKKYQHILNYKYQEPQQ